MLRVNAAIFLRAHTAKNIDKPRQKHERNRDAVPKWPERVLVFDTETRTDIHQELMFGFYRICKLMEHGYVCESEGIVYSGELTNEELGQIGTFVLKTLPDVG